MIQNKFKTGDRVKILDNGDLDIGQKRRVGQIGTIEHPEELAKVGFAPKVIFEDTMKIIFHETKLKKVMEKIKIVSDNIHLLRAFESELKASGFNESVSATPEPYNWLVDIGQRQYYRNTGHELPIYNLPSQYNEALQIVKDQIFPKFKVGDIVKCIKDISNGYFIAEDELYEIAGVGKTGHYIWFKDQPNNDNGGAFESKYFKLATEVEIDQYHEENTAEAKIQKMLGTTEYSIIVRPQESISIGCQTYDIDTLKMLALLLNSGYCDYIQTTIGEINGEIVSQLYKFVK